MRSRIFVSLISLLASLSVPQAFGQAPTATEPQISDTEWVDLYLLVSEVERMHWIKGKRLSLGVTHGEKPVSQERQKMLEVRLLELGFKPLEQEKNCFSPEQKKCLMMPKWDLAMSISVSHQNVTTGEYEVSLRFFPLGGGRSVFMKLDKDRHWIKVRPGSFWEGL